MIWIVVGSILVLAGLVLTVQGILEMRSRSAEQPKGHQAPLFPP